MPLLERKPFTPEKPAKDLKPDEEVFVCRHTNEVFKDYESFFKRTILCNSLVWSCRFSGKSGLTYQEAEESEQEITKFAESLPVPIQRAALTLVHHTQRGRLANLCDEVFSYLKDRFQEGEQVEVQYSGKRRKGVIDRVIEPDELPNGTGDPFDSPKQKTPSESITSPKEKKSDKSVGTPGKSRKQSSGDKNTPTKGRKDSQGRSKSPGKARPSSESDRKRKDSAGEKTPKKGSKSSATEADVIVIDDEDEQKATKKDKAVGTPGTPKKKSSTFNWPSAKGYRYAVRLFPEKVAKKKDGKKQKEEVVIVDVSCLSRKKGDFTREKMKNFLKVSCARSTVSSEDGFYIVEAKYRKKFDLGDVDIPVSLTLESPPSKKRSRKRKKSGTGETEESGQAKKKRRKIEEDMGKKSKDGSSKSKKSGKKLTPEEKLKLIEEEKERKRKQIQEEKEKKRLQKEQDRAELRAKKEEEKVQRKLERDQLRQEIRALKQARKKALEERKKLEREKREAEKAYQVAQQVMKKAEQKRIRDEERERIREQKRHEAILYREWSRPREDLHLDDLKDLPIPVPVKVKFPTHLFGDAVMVLEFLNMFGSLYDMKDEFPSGLTFGMLEEALIEHDAEGVYYDLLQFLLGAILRTHMDEEEDEGLESSLPADTKTALDAVDDEDEHRAVVSASAAMAAVWPILHQGKPLHELIMDPFTCTELLRLHLLSSGARIGCGDSNYRWHSRGGFTYADDAGVEFRHRESGLMRTLMTDTVYDLGVEDKLKILMALCGQLLTYATSRDCVEEGFEKVKKARREWVSDQWKEQRREKEEAAAKYKKKMEEKARQKEEMEKRKKEEEEGKDGGKDNSSKSDEKAAEKPAEEEPSSDSKKGKSKKKQSKTQEKEPTEAEEKKDDEKEKENAEKEPTVEEPPLTKEEEEQRAFERKREREKREQEYLDQVHKGSCMSNIQPLGRDRMYRRYWMFRCLKGLFIEDDDPELPHYLETIVEEEEDSEDEEESVADEEEEEGKNNEKKETDQNDNSTPVIDLTDEKDNETKGEQQGMSERTVNKQIKKMTQDSNITSAPQQNENGKEEIIKNVMNVSERAITRWSFIGSNEDFENLLTSLNPRGFRERCLREALQQDYKRVAKGVTKCPFREENIVPKKEVRPFRGRRTRAQQQGVDKSRYSNMEGFAEANLRDQILDLEERIWQGGLGVIKVEERAVWRAMIESGIYDDVWRNEERNAGESKPEDVESENAKPEDAKPEDAKPEDAKPEGAKPEDGKPEDVKVEENEKRDVEMSVNGKNDKMENDKDSKAVGNVVEENNKPHLNGFTDDEEPMENDDLPTELKTEAIKVETPDNEARPLVNGDVEEADLELVNMEEAKSAQFSAIPSRLKLDLSSEQKVTFATPESRAGTPIISLAPPSFPVKDSVRELALALLKVEQGIELKYLSPPLGEDEETKRQKQKEAAAAALKEYEAMMKAAEKKEKEKSKENKKRKKAEKGEEQKEEERNGKDEEEDGKDDDASSSSSEETPQRMKTVLERWEESLLASTSLSQVFVHLNTLDGSITWSKSVLNARCRLCRRKGDAEKMLLCDACDRGHHMYCLKPPIKQIPEGNWFCPDCRPKEPRRSDRRRKAPTIDEEEEESSDEESSEESGDESNSDTEEYEHIDDESEDATIESTSEHGDTCAVCSEGGELLCCDICPLAYHVHCAYPPLRRVPRGNWACQVCTGADDERPAKTRVRKTTIKAALKKSKEKQKPTKPSKKLNTSKQETKKKSQKRKRSPSPAPRPRSRAENPESAPKAKRQKVTESAKSSRSSSPVVKGNKRPPAKLRIRGRSSMDSSRSPSPARKAPTRRDPRLTGRLLKCDKLINEIMENEDAEFFLGSAPHLKSSDYKKTIKTPIHLTAIQDKLSDQEYESVEDFISDVRKVFIDCAEYFRPRTKEAKAGVRLSALFETRFSDMGLDTSEMRSVRSCRRT